MKLATAADVQARMNVLGIMAGSNAPNIDSALDAATSHIASMLRTPLDSATITDWYDYTVGRFDSPGPVTLWLTQAFLYGRPKVYVSSDGNPIVSVASATLLDAEDYIVDASKGKIEILATVTPGYSALAVKYNAGFTEGSSDIPDWLKEAAISSAIHVIHTQSITHGKKDTKDMSKPMGAMIYSILNEYIVTPYMGLHPARSVKQ